MTLTKSNAAITVAGMVLALSFAMVSAASALTASCAGVPTSTNITWTASSAGGIAPVAYLWGNGSTSSAQTVAYAPGTHSMTIQATDASSTIATSTCTATVAALPVATTTPPVIDVMAQIQVLLTQINALKAQIAQLVAGQIGGGSGTGTTTLPVIGPGGKICVNSIGRDIRRGDYGDDIKDLQKFLAKHPSIYPEGIVNGFYGPLTMQAVKRWQKLNGIEGNGFFGPMTRKFWREYCEDNDGRWMASSTISVSASTSISTWINQALSKKKAGDDHGKNKGKGNDRDDD